MPTAQRTLTIDRLHEQIDRHAFGGRRADVPDRVGLEVEMHVVDMRGARPRAAALAETLPLLASMGESPGWNLERIGDATPSIGLPGGGHITLEPGGQIEYSTCAHACADDALDDVDEVVEQLRRRVGASCMEVRVAGFNDLVPFDEIPLQLHAPRYREMDAHFAAIGPYGRQMMRATCALQINLDFGSGAVAAERWRLANMIAPALNALFANSPREHDGRHYDSWRAEIWRNADPTRTGRLFDRPDLDPVADYLRFALDATVMFLRVGDGELARPGTPMSFREWMERGSEHGYPDLSDWELHLTTLFPDVRARGFMEIRSIDALDGERRREAVGLVTRLLYDDMTRRRALSLLESRERRHRSDDHEHGGYWTADLEAGRELQRIAGERWG